MKKCKVLTVIGTRPEVIKLAPVILELQGNQQFSSIICATAQHRQMLDQAIKPFGIIIDHDLDIMLRGQTLAQVTARAVEGLNEVIAKEKPDIVLVQGDTTTAFCGALAGYYQQVKVGHVEAGLRTGNKFAPYPEEINRRLVGQLTDYHFAPTNEAKEALTKEGIASGDIFITGNTVIDALLWMQNQIKNSTFSISEKLNKAIEGREFILVTGHRRESFGTGFENICWAIRETAEVFPNTVFVYPVHLNPKVQEPVLRILDQHERILLIEPLDYEPFVWLMDQATIVLTDSGGVQEEAPSLGKPVLVMRETTERPEGVRAGNSRLVGTDKERIKAALSELLQSPEKRDAMGQARNPYGDGTAAKKIVTVLENLICKY